MEKETITIETLLRSLQLPQQGSTTLPNNKSTWERMSSKNFPELNLNPSELEGFLQEWVSSNPYSAIA